MDARRNRCFSDGHHPDACGQSHTDLQPVSFPEAHADAGSKGPPWHTADHHRHARLTGQIALHLYLSAHLTVGQVGLVAGAVDRKTPIILLASVSQQSEMAQENRTTKLTALAKKQKQVVVFKFSGTVKFI